MDREKDTVKKPEEPQYVKPETTKHQPVKIVQGSSSCSLYYVSLYYY
jgi:hypothetical protein